MLEKIKNIVSKTDLFLYRKFGSDKSIKYLENIKEAQIIFSYINEHESEDKVKFVGGCVRKALQGEIIDDIDLATTLKPSAVREKLTKKNIKVVDTGISHGTVTAILNKKKFEITTLRKDVSTDGRHANVEFTEDWKEDASRRDFTINAIYADIYGRIFDPFNGISDLQKGEVKFIGLPEERIQEDYLRILRYFRFFIQYSKKDFDSETIKSIRKNINGLNKISNERIFNETEKILSLKDVYKLFSKNPQKEIILNIFPQFKYYERLKIIGNLDKSLQSRYDSNLMLAILIVDHTNDHEFFCHKYKTSNILKSRFKNIAKNFEYLKSKKFFTKENIKKQIYLSNKSKVIDLLLFSISFNKKLKIFDIEQLLEFINITKIPKFPISGDYLKQLGFEPGKALGNKLKSLEEKWIENKFSIDKKLIEKSFSKTNKN